MWYAGMALLSSNVIAELDKRKELNEKKAALSSSQKLTRDPLHPDKSNSAAELKQVNILSFITDAVQ